MNSVMSRSRSAAVTDLHRQRAATRQRMPMEVTTSREEFSRSNMTSFTMTAGQGTLGLLAQFAAIFCLVIAVSGFLSSVEGFAVAPQENGGIAEVASESAEHYLLDHNEDSLTRTRRKASTSSSKTATCSCTCETAVVATPPAPALPASASSGTGVEAKTENNESKPSAAGKLSNVPPSSPSSSSRLGGYAGQFQQRPQQQPLRQQQAVTSGGSQHTSAINSNHVVDNEDVAPSDEPNQINELASLYDYEDAAGIRNSQRKMASQSGEQVIHDTDANDRYRGTYGQGRRHPWMLLPERMCMREPCSSDGDCCRHWNICDRSAHICTNCWYGSPCTGPRHCCLKYPHCQMPASAAGAAKQVVLATESSASVDMDLAPGAGGEVVGKCVDL